MFLGYCVYVDMYVRPYIQQLQVLRKLARVIGTPYAHIKKMPLKLSWKPLKIQQKIKSVVFAKGVSLGLSKILISEAQIGLGKTE